ncbi:hypothetical protein PG989_004493 [Apiospora arundinis]
MGDVINRDMSARSSSTQHGIAGPQDLVDIQKHMVGPRKGRERTSRMLQYKWPTPFLRPLDKPN